MRCGLWSNRNHFRIQPKRQKMTGASKYRVSSRVAAALHDRLMDESIGKFHWDFLPKKGVNPLDSKLRILLIHSTYAVDQMRMCC